MGQRPAVWRAAIGGEKHEANVIRYDINEEIMSARWSFHTSLSRSDYQCKYSLTIAKNHNNDKHKTREPVGCTIVAWSEYIIILCVLFSNNKRVPNTHLCKTTASYQSHTNNGQNWYCVRLPADLCLSLLSSYWLLIYRLSGDVRLLHAELRPALSSFVSVSLRIWNAWNEQGAGHVV